MACNVDTILANAAASGIGGITSRTTLLQVLAQLSSVTCSAPPDAPVMLGPNPTGDANYTIEWEASVGADSYLLDLGEPPDFAFYIFQDEPVVGLSFAVNDVADASRMTRVRAVNACGISDYSNTVSFFTVVIPDAPVALGASYLGLTSMTALWSAPAQFVTDYRLDVSTDPLFGSFFGAYNNLTVAGTSQAVTGMTANTTYYFRVRAVNAAGTSANSNVADFAVVTLIIDTMESYSAGVNLDGLNGGTFWDGAYSSRSNFLLIIDTMESYSAGDNLDGLNGGTNWNGAYASR